jgi:hypothetical protein
MLAAPSIALDLPLKILVAEDAQGKVWLSYNSPEYLKERHGLPSDLLPNIAVEATLADKAGESSSVVATALKTTRRLVSSLCVWVLITFFIDEEKKNTATQSTMPRPIHSSSHEDASRADTSDI